MKDDLYFMAISILAVWREKVPSDYFSCTWVSSSGEDFQTFIFEKETNDFLVILEIFKDKETTSESTLFLTKTPSKVFLDIASSVGISEIYYCPTKDLDFENKTSVKIIPFVNTFGRIIDILAQYKPTASFIDIA